MPVDRTFRERLVGKTIAFVRGEFRSDEFQKFLLDEAHDDSEDAAALCVRWLLKELLTSDYGDHDFSANRNGWDFMLRLLAFLKTDFGLRPQRTENWRAMGWLARGLLLGVLAAAGVSWWLWNWWILVGVWIAAYIAWRVCWPLDTRAGRRLNEQWPLWPFLSAEDWRAHRHLADGLGLPPYDPARYDRPVHSPTKNRRLKIHSAIGSFIHLPITLLADSFASDREISLRTDAPATPEAASPPEPAAG